MGRANRFGFLEVRLEETEGGLVHCGDGAFIAEDSVGGINELDCFGEWDVVPDLGKEESGPREDKFGLDIRGLEVAEDLIELKIALAV